MTVSQYAKRKKVSRSTVYRRIRSGKIPASKVNRRWFIQLVSDMINIKVDWRAVAYNKPSRNMSRSVPWIHGIIRDSQGPSPRIELAPKRSKNNTFPVQLVLAHPDQIAAKSMSWFDVLEVNIDGHTVETQKSIGPANEWCEPEPWALVAKLDVDHPLVLHAAESAKGPQEAMEKAENEFYTYARNWMKRNFPNPDFMNVLRSLMLSEWQNKAGYWPGDPLPDRDAMLYAARDKLRR